MRSFRVVPQDVYGPDFPGETFRVLMEKEIKKCGEYRTRRPVLEAWDRIVRREYGMAKREGCTNCESRGDGEGFSNGVKFLRLLLFKLRLNLLESPHGLRGIESLPTVKANPGLDR